MPQDMVGNYLHHNAFGLAHGANIQHQFYAIYAFELEHDVQCMGYCISSPESRVVYITDTTYTRFTFPKVTHWMIECNHARDILNDNVAAGKLNESLRNRIVKSHMNIETVKHLLLANDLSQTQEIWLLHLSNDNSDAERFRKEVQEVTGKAVYIA
jgi:phosphoribosyl 1,2-cyclic phosphodiesterase